MLYHDTHVESIRSITTSIMHIIQKSQPMPLKSVTDNERNLTVEFNSSEVYMCCNCDWSLQPPPLSDYFNRLSCSISEESILIQMI